MVHYFSVAAVVVAVLMKLRGLEDGGDDAPDGIRADLKA